MADNQQKFNPESISATLEQLLNTTTRNLSVDLLDWMKEIFESRMTDFFLGNKQKITVALIVDSSSVIRALNYHAKGKVSVLSKLAENPIFPLWAPTEIENEIMDYIKNKAKKSLSKSKLKSGWKQLKKAIEIKEIQNSESIRQARQIMARDQNDVPFVSLIIDTNASAIVSEDHDFDCIKRRFTIEQLGDVVGLYHRGLFSFVIMSELVPQVMKFVRELIMIIIKIFSEFLAMIVKVIKYAVSGSISEILKICSRIPSWMSYALIILAILVILSDSARNKILNKAKSMYAKAELFVKKNVFGVNSITGKTLDVR